MQCKSLWWTCSAIQYREKRIRRSAWGRSTFLIMQRNTPSSFYFIQRMCSRNCHTELIHGSVFATNSNVCIWFIQLGPQEAIYMLMPCLLSDAHTSYLSRAPRVWDFLAGVNFYRFNAKKWQFTVYFAIIKQKMAIFCVFCRNLRVFSV